VTVGNDQSVRVWDAETGREVLTIKYTGLIEGAVFSPDGRRLVTESGDGAARVWDAATGQELLALQHTGIVWSAEFSPDGQRLLTAGEDGIARIWDSTPINHAFRPREHAPPPRAAGGQRP
jgi:WD40 repeat protein